MIVASWVAPGSGNPALLLINQIVEPLMKPFRKLLPPMGGIDLSPILVFLVIQVLEVVVKGLQSQVLALA
jgi:YggT family protein